MQMFMNFVIHVYYFFSVTSISVTIMSFTSSVVNLVRFTTLFITLFFILGNRFVTLFLVKNLKKTETLPEFKLNSIKSIISKTIKNVKSLKKNMHLLIKK